MLSNHLDQNPVVEELGTITNGLPIDQQLVERLSAFPKLKKAKIFLDGADADKRNPFNLFVFKLVDFAFRNELIN